MSRNTLCAFMLAALMAVLMAGCAAITTIQPQEIGVVFNVLTGELEEPLGPGTHLVNPITQEVTIYSTAAQEYTMTDADTEGPQDAVIARTADGQEVRLDVTVVYRLDPTRINLVHDRWQTSYEAGWVRPIVRSEVRLFVSHYEARDLAAEGPIIFEEELQNELETQFDAEGLLLDDVLIRDIHYTQEFSATLEAEYLATATAEAQATQAAATPIP